MAILQRHEPWSLLTELNELFNRQLSNQSNSDISKVETSQWLPAVDIKEEKNHFVIYADLPGVKPENIEITMENGMLTLKGQRLEEKKDAQEGYWRVERREGSFYRRFSLPDTADAEGINAKSNHGVLEIIIPKKEKAKARKITVATENAQ